MMRVKRKLFHASGSTLAVITPMCTPDSIESRICEHVLGQGQPSEAILNTGVLSTEWTKAYLCLLKEADKEITLP